ncbi:MAG: hypothetical protein M1365_14770 [Actinobacteria bacterium]|nr:hypothetical protein [Actinomycetota bacterium]
MIYKNIFTKEEKEKINFYRKLLEQMFTMQKPNIIPSYIIDFPHDQEEDKNIKLYLDKQIEFFKSTLKSGIPCVPLLRPFFYGLHGHSKFFNTEVINAGDSYWTKYIDETLMDKIKIINVKKHPFTKNLIAQIEYLQENTNYEIPVATPVIMSPLVIFTNLFDSNVSYVYMIKYPEKVLRITKIITKLIIDLDKFLNLLIKTERGINTRHILNWTPPYYCTLYGCTLKLISKKMYENLFLQYDLMILNNYSGGGFHLCGDTYHLVDIFKNIKKLVFFQINDEASDCFENFFKKLRKDQVFFVWPSKKMSVKKILEISGGLAGGNRIIYGGVPLNELN